MADEKKGRRGRRFSAEFIEKSTEEELKAIEKFEQELSGEDHILTEGQYSELFNTFALFDKDNSGCISVTELRSIMNTLGRPQTAQEMTEIMAAIDSDGSGEIDFTEFLHLMAPRMSDLEEGLEQAMLEVFKALDKDGSGYLCADEIQQIMTQLGNPITIEDAQAMIHEADFDDDGRIQFNELLRIMHE